MRKIYSLVLMTAMLFVGANAWAVTRTASNATEFETAWKAAQNGDIIQLTNDVTIKKILWLGTANMNDASKSLTLDLNGHVLTNDENLKYMFIITHGELNVITTVAGGTIIQNGASNEELFRINGSTYKNVNPKTATSGYFSHLVIGTGVTVNAKKNAIVVDVINPGTSTSIGTTSSNAIGTAGTTVPNSSVPYSARIFKSGYGVAYGVRVDVHGNIEAQKYAFKTNGNLGLPGVNPAIDGMATSFQDDPVNPSATYTAVAADTAWTPFVRLYSTADLRVPATSDNTKKPVAVYCSGYARWLIEGTCVGSTGVYVKSGEVDIHDAIIESNYTGDYVAPSGHEGSGVNAQGSGIVIESHDAYAGGIDVEVSGDTKVTATNGYAIDEKVTTTGDTTKVNTVSISGGTFEGGNVGTSENPQQGTISISETTKVANEDSQKTTTIVVGGGNVEGNVTVGNEGDINDIVDNTQSYTTTVTDPETGKQTVVISQGEEPTAVASNFNVDTVAHKIDVLMDDAVTTKNQVITGTNKTVTLGTLTMNPTTTPVTLTVNATNTLIVDKIIMGYKAQIIVEPGASLIVMGEQGITAPAVDNIILKASETAQAKFLFNPAVSSNRQPKATVQIYTYAKQNSATSFTWQRLVSPMTSIDNITSNGAGATLSPGDAIGTYRWWVERWDYTQTKWKNITAFDQIKAFDGIQLTNNTRDGGITYSFTGNLQGTVDNTIKFNGIGYNFFGNSYTAPMSLSEILSTLDVMTSDVDHSIWLWDRSGRYVSTNKWLFDSGMWDGSVEIPALSSFIMKQDYESINMDLNYTNTVWNYNMGITPAPVVARANNNINAVRINLASSEGDEDYVFIAEDENLTANYDNGADAAKLMQTGRINFYVMAENDNLSICGTNDIVGTMLSLETQNDINYTLTFSNVRGEVYALRDNLTNAVVLMNEGATYNFTAQPNATLEGRFQIVSRQEMPTAVETIEETVAPKAIYTVMGQYVGETTDWNNLPAGVYVVDGVKVVK